MPVKTTEPEPEHVLLTPDEVAALLRTSRLAIYAMVSREQIPGALKIGRRLLFRRAVVERWLDRR